MAMNTQKAVTMIIMIIMIIIIMNAIFRYSLRDARMHLGDYKCIIVCMHGNIQS